MEIAHELDDARPLEVNGAASDNEDEMDDGHGSARDVQLSGGLIDFVNTVMAGLVGASPHMQVRSIINWKLHHTFLFAGVFMMT